MKRKIDARLEESAQQNSTNKPSLVDETLKGERGTGDMKIGTRAIKQLNCEGLDR